MLSFSLVAEALTGLIYHRPSGENSKFAKTFCLMMGEASLETSPKNTMIQDMINSETIWIQLNRQTQTYLSVLHQQLHKTMYLLSEEFWLIRMSN